MKSYFRMLGLVRPHSKIFALAIVCIAFSSAFESFSLGAIIPLIDVILAGKPISLPNTNAPAWIIGLVDTLNALPRGVLLNRLIIGIIVIFVLKEIFIFLQSYLMSDIGLRVVRDVNQKIYSHLLTLSLDFFVKTPAGKLMSRITNDTAYLRMATSEGLLELLYQPIKLVLYIVLLLSVRSFFNIPWILVTVSFVLIPTVIYPIVRIGEKVKKLSIASQEGVSKINVSLHETISGMRVVKGFCMEDYERKRFMAHTQLVYRTFMKSIKRILAVSPLTELVGVTCLSLVLWIGGKEVINGNLSPGAFVTFLAAALSLVKPFKRLGKIHSINQQGVAASERVFEILDEKSSIVEVPDAPALPPIKKAITFNEITFRYEDNIVIDRLNLEAKAGAITAIVGPSGVGKTTLVNLVPRFYDPSDGVVLIDGVDIKEVSVRSLRDQIGLVTQETILFHDTVRDNIAYGLRDISDEKIIQAARVANAHEFIEKMPKGYDTMIGERGFRLSGGQRQRLAIARAILKDPPILILDEATSQLDTVSEGLVQEAIERLMTGRTTLVIAHRLSTIKRADKIVVLEKGKIAQIGSHEELIEKEGPYKTLYAMQIAQAL